MHGETIKLHTHIYTWTIFCALCCLMHIEYIIKLLRWKLHENSSNIPYSFKICF